MYCHTERTSPLNMELQSNSAELKNSVVLRHQKLKLHKSNKYTLAKQVQMLNIKA